LIKVSAPNNLDWTVKRHLLPDWMRPIALGDAARFYERRPDSPLQGGIRLGGPAVFCGLIWSLATLPLLPLVILLRRAGVVPWTIEAIARPWGRRGPPMVLRYQVRGRAETDRALADLVRALERGDGGPALEGAERIE
jgi:hypothetical protein